LKLRLLAVTCLFAVCGATAAQARLEPNPPPSGIVVHLFGPNSIMQSVAPALASAPDGAQPAVAPSGGQSDIGPAAAPAEPTWGNVLHQMFVTGDPDAPNQPARGKVGHQLED
jgi:hypothetical protein